MMEKVNDEAIMLAEVNHAKEQTERERKIHIEKKFELNKRNMVACALPHERPSVEDKDNNMLFKRMKTPLHIFKTFSNGSIEEGEIHDTFELPSVKLPIVERPPRSITWVFRDRNQLMAESDSVIGKKQIYYEDGKAKELSDDEEREEKEDDKEEAEKEKHGFRMLKNEGNSGGASSSSKDTFVDHFCNRCLIFDCQMHESSLHVSVTKPVNKKTPHKQKTNLSKKNKRKRKNTCLPIVLRKAVKGETKVYKQYTPCICESVCGNECTCLANGNCCEKYCGCSEICNNRFTGCNCANGQCRDRRCPCFAANRECDPDICQGCWLSCGDDSFGERSTEIQCKNMKFLQKKHKKILIGKSDIQGWGAFTQHSLEENEFIGEFTGELISYEEAEVRGRVEKKLGYSYLFDVNDEFTLDARRQGNKLKFLNHSSNPNCYSKAVIVRGDHRIGLFAAKAIQAGEELFFDYDYKPGVQPSWYPN